MSEHKMQLTSPAFSDGETIPKKYTCDGEDISPPLIFSNVPEETQSLALLMDDPDAPVGVWDHWILFNIPAEVQGLEENRPKEPELPDGSRHGANSWERNEYGGPCPPSGQHRYYFKLYALRQKLSLEVGADKQTVLRAMEDHILQEATLLGMFR